MNTQVELHGKYLIGYLPKNDGISIANIEKIDKFTDIYESSEGRFSPKFNITDTIEEMINFVYEMHLYISKDDATDIVNEYLN